MKNFANALSRRTFATLCAAPVLAALASAAPAAQAADWPDKPVRLIVPFPPGAAPDVIARIMADRLGKKWGQTVVVENRAGAGGIPGMSALVRSPADGYTLGFVPAAVATLTPQLFKDPQFNMQRDLVPAAMIGTSPMMVAVSASSDIKTLADLIAKAKANPGKLNFAAAQAYSVPHLTGAVLASAAGINLYTVPYSGSPTATLAVLKGEADLTVDGLPALAEQTKSGKLRALAVTSNHRLPGYDNVPAAGEALPGFESIGWFGIFAPTGTPRNVVERVNRDTNELMQAPDLIAHLSELGVYPAPGTPQDLGKFVVQQQAIWKKVVQKLGLQPQ